MMISSIQKKNSLLRLEQRSNLNKLGKVKGWQIRI